MEQNRRGAETGGGVRWSLPALLIVLAGCASNPPAPVDEIALDGQPSRPPSAASPSGPITGADARTYRVAAGDTLYGIAFKNGLDYRDVARWNGIGPPYRILAGQTLRLTPPDAGAPVDTVASANAAAGAGTSGPHDVVAVDAGSEETRTTPSASPPSAPQLVVESLDEAPAAGPGNASAVPSGTASRETATPEAAEHSAASASAAAEAGSHGPASAEVRTVGAGGKAPSAMEATASTSGPAVPPSSRAERADAAGPKGDTAPPPVVPVPLTGETAPAKAPEAVASVGGIRWRWPAGGRLVGNFVAGDQTRQGIDIVGKAGDPVQAAADGTVVYSGNGLLGYGELIIVKHSPAFLSAYGRNRKRLVKEGDTVKAGQTIAEMGSITADRDALHFEIRRNGKPVNPLEFLPAR